MREVENYKRNQDRLRLKLEKIGKENRSASDVGTAADICRGRERP